MFQKWNDVSEIIQPFDRLSACPFAKAMHLPERNKTWIPLLAKPSQCQPLLTAASLATAASPASVSATPSATAVIPIYSYLIFQSVSLPSSIEWVPCFEARQANYNLTFECANLTVPLEYLNPKSSNTTQIGIAKAHRWLIRGGYQQSHLHQIKND